jgi:hypothetical protein
LILKDFNRGEIKNRVEHYKRDDEKDSPFFPEVSSDEESDSKIDDDEYYIKVLVTD